MRSIAGLSVAIAQPQQPIDSLSANPPSVAAYTADVMRGGVQYSPTPLRRPRHAALT
jgi:hypothetical protein